MTDKEWATRLEQFRAGMVTSSGHPHLSRSGSGRITRVLVPPTVIVSSIVTERVVMKLLVMLAVPPLKVSIAPTCLLKTKFIMPCETR